MPVQVILREEVPNLGTIGDVVNVRRGYARNYLLPRGLALEASTRNLRELAHQKRVVSERRLRAAKAAAVVAERINGTALSFTMRAGDEGKLFGSVTNLDVQRAMEDRGIAIERRRIVLQEPIKTLGEHAVTVHVGPDTRATIRVTVLALEEPAEEAPAETDTPTPSGDAAEESTEPEA